MVLDSRYSNVSDERVNTILVGLDEQKDLLNTIHQNLKELNLHVSILSGSYIELITKCLPPHLESLSITIYDVDMYDWIEQAGWDYVLKLAHHMQLIPSVSIKFRSDIIDYEESEPRQESRMTKFYKLLGNITAGRSNLYHSIHATDHTSSNTSIEIIKNKEVFLEYGLGQEDFGEFPVQIARHRQEAQQEQQEEEEEEDPKRTPPCSYTVITNTFQVPLPDINKSLIGPEVINNWSLYISRGYSSILYQVFKYIIMNCPRFHYLVLYGRGTCQRIHLSPSRETTSDDPSISSQELIKCARLIAFTYSRIFGFIINSLARYEKSYLYR